MIDCNLLREVYINLVDQKAPKLNLENVGIADSKFNSNNNIKGSIIRKIIKPDSKELKLHKEYLKSYLPKNYYN